ncbi:hypothetical protein CQW23_32756 [Capsicum baccatum]|uniref:Uncharacterized protein n=1 Tax=Capsicum baccatum TaxID=33114 RepID=A0A2G2V3V4_CAPBA|nr:hypothetical protein CQW23_32756 [Capsicum baccatum]
MELEKGFSPAADIPVFGYTCIGIVCIKDPVCPGVRESVALCRSAGVNVRMVTVHNLLPDRQPVYDKRNDIIKAIPDFWLTSFLSHPVLGKLLNEEDHKYETAHLALVEPQDPIVEIQKTIEMNL